MFFAFVPACTGKHDASARKARGASQLVEREKILDHVFAPLLMSVTSLKLFLPFTRKTRLKKLTPGYSEVYVQNMLIEQEGKCLITMVILVLLF